MSRTSFAAPRTLGTALAAALALGLPALADAQPRMDRTEAAQLYTAAGFPIVDDQPVNRCAQPARPRITFVDLNSDRRAEALFIDTNAECYAPSGRYFALLTKDGNQWRTLISGAGTIQAQRSSTAGWPDQRVSDSTCTRDFRFAGNAYAAVSGCAGESVAAAAPARAATTPAMARAPTTPTTPTTRTTANATDTTSTAAAPAAASGTLASADTAAAFKAAGLTQRGNTWRSDCDDPGTASYSPGHIEQVSDLNGDGLQDVVITESGTFCYGNTGTAFWLVAKLADGRWKLMTRNTGMPEFLKTKGAQGWPDILIGGPGFCFPVERWNGSEYKLQRWEYDGKTCKPRR